VKIQPQWVVAPGKQTNYIGTRLINKLVAIERDVLGDQISRDGDKK
jgi:hypothetical protein